MDEVRIGQALRAMRRHRRLRQVDVARRASVPRETVILLERGDLGSIPLGRLRAVAAVLGLRSDVRIHLPGGDLERVVNAGHADLHERAAASLAELGSWTWQPEVTFSIYGERGIIDILAWHALSGCLLVIELKTRLVDPQELVAVIDRRRRLARRIAAGQDWSPRFVSTWVLVSDTSTNRRRLRAHRRLLRTAFPTDGRVMRSWLRRPYGPVDALTFLSDIAVGDPRRVGRR